MTGTVAFVRTITAGLAGPDVLAVKRALVKWNKGLRAGVALDETMGSQAVTLLRRFQRAEFLTADGTYGPTTHKRLSPFFDAYGASLLHQEAAALAPVAKMKAAGVEFPEDTFAAANLASLPLNYACALIEKESALGKNLWGHDPTIFVGGYDSLHRHAYGPTVTEAAYKAYLAQRGTAGRGGMQGVGPPQLTYFSYQDQADQLGGCWIPLHSMTVGFRALKQNIDRNGEEAGAAAYNGSGENAVHYGEDFVVKAAAWKKRLQ